MKVTFLLGNGFDIGLGLKTRYEDFYKIYQEEEKKDDPNIREFKAVLRDRSKINKIIDWSDFEKAFGAHSRDFDIEGKQLYIDRFKHFIRRFNRYLEEEVKKLDYSNRKLIGDTMLKGIAEYFYIRTGAKEAIQRLYTGNDRVYNFISFNYTKSIDVCTDILKSILLEEKKSRRVGRVVHLHGYIEKNMILGVNDSTQILNENFSKDDKIVKLLVKPKQNALLKTTYDSQARTVIDQSNIICVYGMSIGETDKDWWDYISNWLSRNTSRALVILKHDDEYDERFTFVQQEMMDEVLETFLSYSTLDDTVKEKITDRIYIDFNHDIFQMGLCKNQNIEDSTIDNETLIDTINRISEELKEGNVVEF